MIETTRPLDAHWASRAPLLWRRIGTWLFSALVLAALLLPLVIELVSEQWVQLEVVGRVLGLLLPILLVAGVVCLQRWRAIGLAMAALVATSLFVWALPLQRREHFAADVHSLRVGMTPAEVEAIMQPHVRGATGVSDFFDTVRREQPFADQTYYEAQDEHHSFDNFCLVTWKDGRVAAVSLHED